jgi:hypothetical protein
MMAMSVSFYGMTADGEPVALDFETDAAHLNIASANARSFLAFLGLEPGEHLSGEVGMPEARRAIMRARATFERRVGGFTRRGTDTKRPGLCRVIEGGIDAGYFARRIDDFEAFLDAMAAKGAKAIYWG